jgi:hypothetical protein
MAQVLASITTRIAILNATERIIEESHSNLDTLGMMLEHAALMGAREERRNLENSASSLRRQLELEGA